LVKESNAKNSKEVMVGVVFDSPVTYVFFQVESMRNNYFFTLLFFNLNFFFQVEILKKNSVFLMLYTFLLVWSVASLGGFHAYLIVRGRSTHEEVQKKLAGKII
jgi:hypothetical protein